MEHRVFIGLCLLSGAAIIEYGFKWGRSFPAAINYDSNDVF